MVHIILLHIVLRVYHVKFRRTEGRKNNNNNKKKHAVETFFTQTMNLIDVPGRKGIKLGRPQKERGRPGTCKKVYKHIKCY